MLKPIIQTTAPRSVSRRAAPVGDPDGWKFGASLQMAGQHENYIDQSQWELVEAAALEAMLAVREGSDNNRTAGFNAEAPHGLCGACPRHRRRQDSFEQLRHRRCRIKGTFL